mmetsp:Transcript_3481/g.9233  ORF Transcript_3481/g.9233 Transcript_3481/m.9233 type:complete len:220 (+) Transcript_3481:2148-2807(+)
MSIHFWRCFRSKLQRSMMGHLPSWMVWRHMASHARRLPSSSWLMRTNLKGMVCTKARANVDLPEPGRPHIMTMNGLKAMFSCVGSTVSMLDARSVANCLACCASPPRCCCCFCKVDLSFFKRFFLVGTMSHMPSSSSLEMSAASALCVRLWASPIVAPFADWVDFMATADDGLRVWDARTSVTETSKEEAVGRVEEFVAMEMVATMMMEEIRCDLRLML